MVLNLKFCKLRLYKHYLICEINEGETITIEKNRTVIKFALEYYKEKTFSLIVNKSNSYSVDPMIYVEINKVKNLNGIAVFSEDSRNNVSFTIEKLFYNKPFECFFSINEAIEWVKSLDYTNNSSSPIAM